MKDRILQREESVSLGVEILFFDGVYCVGLTRSGEEN